MQFGSLNFFEKKKLDNILSLSRREFCWKWQKPWPIARIILRQQCRGCHKASNFNFMVNIPGLADRERGNVKGRAMLNTVVSLFIAWMTDSVLDVRSWRGWWRCHRMFQQPLLACQNTFKWKQFKRNRFILFHPKRIFALKTRLLEKDKL